ncbi:McrC family protein [Arthrobacter caoxuetaonis]|uniref:McrC family protein n=1 Tax=Arthrobacter caoxuetaonis TaxID=2886935 RepID=A0A9X1ME47_9MICC|nr:McrC family protein [Arthrobacter caoxuetaonis]MCC3297540.1 McrC family protein [Arthrobacter caoxuetaonis]USQ57929.1 McrC family protein [Arthrobacter caoxuetaonis]
MPFATMGPERLGTPPVFFDAKYKVSSAVGKYANADHYQMLAYRAGGIRSLAGQYKGWRASLSPG